MPECQQLKDLGPNECHMLLVSLLTSSVFQNVFEMLNNVDFILSNVIFGIIRRYTVIHRDRETERMRKR